MDLRVECCLELWQDRVGLKLSKSYTAFPADLRVDCCPTSTHHHSNHQSYSNKTETEYLESNYSHSLAPSGVRTEDVAPNWNKDLVSSGLYVQNQDGMVIADARSSTTHHLSLHSSVLFTQNSVIIILGWTPVLMSKVRMIRLSPTPEVRLRTTLSLPRSDCILRVQDKTKLGGLKSKRQVFGRFTPAKWNIVDPKIQPEEMAITSLTQHFHVTNWSAVLEYLLESTVVNSMFCTVNSYFNSELYPTICPKIQCSPNFGHYLNSTAIRLLLTNDIQIKLYFQSVTLTLQYSLYRFNLWSLLCVSITV